MKGETFQPRELKLESPREGNSDLQDIISQLLTT